MRKSSSISGMFLVLFAGLAVGATPEPLGKQISDFTLRDFRGKERSLSEYAGRPVAVVFIGSDCPIAKLYAPRLEELYQEFKGKGVGLLAINSNCQDTMTKVGAYARIHKLSYPVLKDPNNAVADMFQAKRTPQAYLLDGDRVVRYVGRIDDQYGLGATSGYAKPELEASYLARAIEEVLAGQEVSVSQTDVTGCIIGRVPQVEPHGDVTYSNQISRILNNSCVSCHREGEIAPFPLTNYDEVNGWGEMMIEVIDKGQMPPWFANPEHGEFKNDCRLSIDEKRLIKTWVSNGSPEGDPADLPSPPQFAKGWQIPAPDEVHYMTEEPFNVPAEGVVEYKYFSVDPGWTEGKWIRAAEARPDNRAVVHHIIVYAVPENSRKRATRHPSVAGFAPGSPARNYSEGVAKFVPAGSKLVFQMHYTPNGSLQEDRSYVGFVFADESEVERAAAGGLVGNWSFAILPHDAHHKVVGEREFSKDALLTSMLPHMHLRGKSYRYTAVYPDGSEEILLDVPNYDFNWQLRYEFVEPKLMPKGTKLRGVAYYDNSKANLANPDPSATVRYGDQTWEEMMHGFYGSISVEKRQRSNDRKIE
jgi:peroxiredoxin